jgi:hypothetical protein
MASVPTCGAPPITDAATTELVKEVLDKAAIALARVTGASQADALDAVAQLVRAATYVVEVREAARDTRRAEMARKILRGP